MYVDNRFPISTEHGHQIAPIEEIIEEARQGRMFILVDDEGRENEGDLVIPAQMATAAAVNFMARYGRGLVCLTLTAERVAALDLPLMAESNGTRHQTAFTVSIEAREGVTTGISAADRARTIAVAIDPRLGRADLVCPGHIFPLAARDGGVLVRAGHTEASVDIARLAGLDPSAVICEIMNDDGSMARMPDLVRFAQRHGLKIGAIADLIAYRRRSEKIVRRVVETELNAAHGGTWRLIVYADGCDGGEHLALVKGTVDATAPTLVRVHALDLLDDVLGDAAGPRTGALHAAMRSIGEAGNGVIVLVRNATPATLAQRLAERLGGERREAVLRHYGIGAEILRDLGVREMILLTKAPKAIVGLDAYGLTVVAQAGW